ncbi:hypothetical protein PoB_005658500 [Plakobranchus ocellatus]|uniref:Uncharacterized protein n=1 Tax=Plakobranchus ocellatus TaxID=259542 RepID=A0AAV4CEF3_9GAST|nr:hypothetical protein PoB_005658500 [Plakobranchus ocellatus]
MRSPQNSVGLASDSHLILGNTRRTRHVATTASRLLGPGFRHARYAEVSRLPGEAGLMRRLNPRAKRMTNISARTLNLTADSRQGLANPNKLSGSYTNLVCDAVQTMNNWLVCIKDNYDFKLCLMCEEDERWTGKWCEENLEKLNCR